MSLWKKGIERSKTGGYRKEDYLENLHHFCEQLTDKIQLTLTSHPDKYIAKSKCNFSIDDELILNCRKIYFIIDTFMVILTVSPEMSKYDIYLSLMIRLSQSLHDPLTYLHQNLPKTITNDIFRNNF